MRISALACAVPGTVVPLDEQHFPFSGKDLSSISKMTGIRQLHRAGDGVTAADLCVAAAQELMVKGKRNPKACDFLLFMTQTPDMLMPPTACVLQHRLGLRNNILAFDVNKGCMGFTDGLLLAQSLCKGLGLRNGLLLVGDTYSKVIEHTDRQTSCLFGDAGSAVWVEEDGEDEILAFAYGTDGSGADHLIQRFGCKYSLPTLLRERKISAEADPFLRMDGAEVFAFTMDRVPELIKETLFRASWQCDDVDAFILHQANRFILENIAKRAGCSPTKMWSSLEHYGNTTGASIPLTMVVCGQEILSQPGKFLLAGYGIGLAWSAVALDSRGIEVFPVVEV